ncbi:mitochondrial dicarboxylate/tricarboxylate transporter DTC-like [Hibiscus syriacus]|uniref:mitochondrial dicarboxylate/tricarboxylate transporter DTC-like n=1 Tax=Hibiscus syriacus TaxID=106335 RepID=UPI001924A30C|nr:mitochondrial dicarboxylate/tricarboxylate transporter DTC-like [Hibiscus syriacus]
MGRSGGPNVTSRIRSGYLHRSGGLQEALTFIPEGFVWSDCWCYWGCVGSPADLALIRMQADATLPAAQRRNYSNAFHTLYRIVGVLALWKGAGPTVVRAMALNMGMLASYDQSVEFFKDNLGLGEAATVVGASTISGFFASACSLPFDYVKTQIQKMQPDATGKYPYTGSLDCAMKTLKAGGPFKFYTGFPVYCVRIAPHVMMTWIFLNQIQKVEKKIGL